MNIKVLEAAQPRRPVAHFVPILQTLKFVNNSLPPTEVALVALAAVLTRPLVGLIVRRTPPLAKNLEGQETRLNTVQRPLIVLGRAQLVNVQVEQFMGETQLRSARNITALGQVLTVSVEAPRIIKKNGRVSVPNILVVRGRVRVANVANRKVAQPLVGLIARLPVEAVMTQRPNVRNIQAALGLAPLASALQSRAQAQRVYSKSSFSIFWVDSYDITYLVKKELFIHFAFLISFFILISLFRGYFSLLYWPFWLGGILGTLMPDLDHFLYVYFLRPQELTSQRVNYMLGKGEILKTLDLLAETRYERTKLIFHTIFFQIIFLVLSFLVISSSGSIFGRGLVLAFLLHLSIDQIIDLRETGGFSNWLKDVPFTLDRTRTIYYVVATFLVILLFGFLL